MKSKIKKIVGQGLAPVVKKLLSLMLAIAMLFSITVGIDLSAYAATAHTQQEAVNWANSQVGKSLDQDGVYGAQCVDLIRYYYIYLGASPVGGNGCDYATNALPSGWSRIKYYSGFTPQPGDVAVWTYASSSYGHVAIVTSANSSNMNVVEQNGSTHVTRSHSYSYSYGTFWGVIRPDFSHDTTPPVISNSNISNVTGNSFTIKCNLYDNVGVIRVWLNVYGPNGSSKGYSVNASNGTFTHTIYTSDYAGPGLYSVHIYAQDAAGNESASRIDNIQAITDNIAPSITNACITNISVSSFTVNCMLNDNVGVTRVWLNVYGPAGTFKGYSVNATNGSFKHTINTSDYAGSGQYAVHIYAFDEAGNETAYAIKEFMVEDHIHEYQSKITKTATCATTGTKLYTCACGATKTEAIPATGHTTVTDKAVAATCTKAGKTAGSHCSVCNTVIKAQTTVKATGHSYDAGKITKKATVTTAGVKTYTCTKCKATKTETIAALGLKTPTLKGVVNANGSFTLSWGKVTGAEKYGIYAKQADGTYKWVKTVTGTSWTTGTAEYGKQYTYRMLAVTGNVTSNNSNAVTVKNTKKLQTPTTKAVVNANGSFTLSWNKVAGAEKYGIYAKQANGTYKWVKTVTGTSFTTATAEYGKQYTYRILAVTGNVTSNNSNVVNVKNTKKLQTPTLKATVNKNGSFKLSWNKVTGATKYGIYVKQSNGTYKWLRTVTGTSYTTGVAAKDTTYSYKVIAVTDKNKSATSNYSNVVSAKRK